MTTSHASLARALTDALGLAAPPVAVAFAGEVPPGAPLHGGHAPDVEAGGNPTMAGSLQRRRTAG